MKVSFGLLQLVFGKNYASIEIMLPAPPFHLRVPFQHLIWPTCSLVSFSDLSCDMKAYGRFELFDQRDFG